jgi:membrane-associated phospholipid phosphatase
MTWQNGVMADARRTPFIPDAARVKAYLSWVGVITVVFFAVYPTINWFTETRPHRYQLYLPFELDIPLVPVFIWAYISMYALFLMPLFMVSAKRMHALGKQLTAGTVICGIVFLMLPANLGFIREVPSHPLYASAFSALFGVDKPHNLMPSLHVVFSCLILFMCREGHHVILRVLLFVWVVLIVASTVLVHQHHLIDALTGLAVTMLLRRYIRPEP